VVCLEFDHVRGTKRGNIARMLGNHSWAVIAAEIDNCEVRCANCHRRKTVRQRGWYKVRLGCTGWYKVRLGKPRP
jgi:hypothetical protein